MYACVHIPMKVYIIYFMDFFQVGWCWRVIVEPPCYLSTATQLVVPERRERKGGSAIAATPLSLSLSPLPPPPSTISLPLVSPSAAVVPTGNISRAIFSSRPFLHVIYHRAKSRLPPSMSSQSHPFMSKYFRKKKKFWKFTISKTSFESWIQGWKTIIN